jgi:hypothetical protein
MERFDVAIVATLRPDLLRQTLISFCDKLWKEWADHAYFYVNVDKAGCEDKDEIEYRMYEIEKLMYNLFNASKVKINFKDPDFPSAWVWGISQTTSRLVFHLEEDWIVNYDHDFGKMVKCFDKYENLKHLRLNQFVSKEKETKMWGKFFAMWNGDFFVIEEKGVAPVGWCGHPSLNRGDWLRVAAKDINIERNPEKQFHYYPDFVKKHVTGNQFGIFQPQNSGRAIADIGRPWMKEHGYEKTGGVNVEWFTHWKKS